MRHRVDRFDGAHVVHREQRPEQGRDDLLRPEVLDHTYEETPFGLVALLGDICYYGRFEERFDDVFRRPMTPLIDAGVAFELAIGNHDSDVSYSDSGLEE